MAHTMDVLLITYIQCTVAPVGSVINNRELLACIKESECVLCRHIDMS